MGEVVQLVSAGAPRGRRCAWLEVGRALTLEGLVITFEVDRVDEELLPVARLRLGSTVCPA